MEPEELMSGMVDVNQCPTCLIDYDEPVPPHACSNDETITCTCCLTCTYICNHDI